VEEHGVTKEFIEKFSHYIANNVSKPFNKVENLLEADTDTLRISIVHESSAISGRSVCIRKTLPTVRMTRESMITDEYCTTEVLELLTNCVKARMNFVFCGEPGVGKTEGIKFFSQYIPANERVITIEDTPELHYREINPEKDCVELMVSDGFSYTKAIKTTDGFEVLQLYNLTDGLLEDTDQDGVMDTEEDPDSDGLTNIQEQNHGTDPLIPDTDNDELTDSFEVNEFGTSPILYDTDEDGLSDGSEHRLGTNPNNSDTDSDGIIDSLELYNQTVTSTETTASLEITAEGDVFSSVSINTLPEDFFLKDMEGIVSQPVDFEVDVAFEKAKVYIPLDENKIPNQDYDNVKMFYFDEEQMTLLPLDKQGIDSETGMVWGETNHFTTFVLFYIPNWKVLWEQPLNKGERTTSTQTTYMDVAFVLDSSGSMGWNDPDGYRKTAAKSFVDALIEGDKGCVVDFDSYARLTLGLTDKLDSVKTAINGIDSDGGTDIGAGVRIANNELISKSSANRIKAMILLTDGEGSYDTSLTKQAKDNNIVIYTVGLGTSVDSTLLTSIADGTGGMYFPVSSASQLPEVFSRITEIVNDAVDTDGDGLYDNAELNGMRDGLGQMYYSNPNSKDTDEDGLSDDSEVGPILTGLSGGYYMASSNPSAVDTDKDGLTDAEESDIGTKKYSSDSDNDKLDDLKEVDMGYNPLNANSDGDTFKDKKEYDKGLDPFYYDNAWDEHVKNILAGATCGDFGKTLVSWGRMKESTYNSLGYISGQIASGFVVVGDIRDFIATVGQGDFWGSLLNAVGVVPAVGDAGKVASTLVDFGKRSTKNLPKISVYIIRELDKVPKVKKAVLGKVIPLLCKGDTVVDTLKAAGKISDDTLAFLAKRANDIPKLAAMTAKGLKFSDEIVTTAKKTIVNDRVAKYWGTGLSKKRMAEAVATETAIVRYEDLGYELLYAQRSLLKNGVHGPDIIMKKGDDVLIVEAKGSYAAKAEISDGKSAGNRLYSKVGKIDTLYLSKDWLIINNEPRYMNKLESLIAAGRNSADNLKYDEAYDAMSDIIKKKKAYKAAVVYVGGNESDINWGRNISKYAEALLGDEENVKALDMVKIKY